LEQATEALSKLLESKNVLQKKNEIRAMLLKLLNAYDGLIDVTKKQQAKEYDLSASDVKQHPQATKK